MASTKNTSKKSSPKAAKKSAPKKTASKRAAKTAALKNPPVQERNSIFRRKTIAERTVAFKTRNWAAVAGWAGIILFSLLALFLNFFMVGYSFSVLVCLCVIGIILVYKGLRLLGSKYPHDARILKRIFTVVLCIGLLVVGVTECIIIDASFGDPKEHCDYMVVLGAGVHGDQPSLSLRNRIDAAYDYLTTHPDVIAVLSGGQGEGENLTEAQCMFDHLTAMGIAEDRLILEDQATSTWENLQFSLDLIEETAGQRPEKLGVLSSEYHLFRASLFADACGVEFVGVPAKTTKLSLRINYFLREVAGVWHYLLLGGQYHD
ncbi:MAG: YdcF family protein [Oscillospiraceae bacterium]|nr:YdcF family protein [Oscillospiraceae bacterium]